MIYRWFIFVVMLLAIGATAKERPNVLMISVDDMNDWTSVLGGYAGQVHTPNLERLAKRAVNFTNAHTASPVCCPSRTALLHCTSAVCRRGMYRILLQSFWNPLL